MQLLRRFRSLIEEIVLEDPDESGKYADCSVCYEELNKDSLPAAYVLIVISDHISDRTSSYPKSQLIDFSCGSVTYFPGPTDFPANTSSIWSVFGS
jgi:hypothetical protein